MVRNVAWFDFFGDGKPRDTGELRRVVGDLSQLAGVTPIAYEEGSAHGVRAYQVRNGGGLRCSVVLDRGMEIAEAEYAGIPFGWHTGVGPANPAFYEPEGTGWLHTYAGGLMTLGGLSQMGEPCEEDGIPYGLHGRAATLVARETSYRVDWDSGVIVILGTLCEVTPTKRFLELHRRVEIPIGGTLIDITDRVINRGFACAEHMILYHLNLGYPLLDQGSRFVAPVVDTMGWDEPSELNRAASACTPGIVGEEYLFGHTVSTRDGWTTAALVHPLLANGLYCAVRYRPDTLPHLWQWVSLRPGSFVMGIEPANSDIRGRVAARQAGNLPLLEPGEEVTYRVQIEFGSGKSAIDRLMSEVQAQGAGR